VTFKPWHRSVTQPKPWSHRNLGLVDGNRHLDRASEPGQQRPVRYPVGSPYDGERPYLHVSVTMAEQWGERLGSPIWTTPTASVPPAPFDNTTWVTNRVYVRTTSRRWKPADVHIYVTAPSTAGTYNSSGACDSKTWTGSAS